MPYNMDRKMLLRPLPPFISGEEVSARWKRAYSGEVIMTVEDAP